MAQPESDEARLIRETVAGVDIVLATAPSLFSPRRIDAGTLALLSAVAFNEDDKVLDLGCGYGVVGIVAAKKIGAERVFMVDSDALAVTVARDNAQRNGVVGVTVLHGDGLAALNETGFTQILCNPPYHVDFAVPKRFIQKGFNRLTIGGRFALVTQRPTWYRNKLGAIFGNVTGQVVGPYHILTATRRSYQRAR